MLKEFKGEQTAEKPTLPPTIDGKVIPQPLSVLRFRVNRGVLELLVHWVGQSD